MKTLVLITSQFPFGKGESFVGAELPYLARSFDKIIIISQNTSGEKTINTPDNVKVFRYSTSTSIGGFLYLPIIFILNSGEIINMLREEIEFRLIIKDHLTIGKFFFLFKKIIKAIQLRDFIIKRTDEENVSGSIVFYSYWLKTGAHAVAMLKYRDSIKIARAHGSDIYEEKTISGFLPLFKFSALNLDAIFFISNQGKHYFEDKLKMESPRFIVSYLGVEKPDSENMEFEKSNKYVVVSCSNMVPLKRIDLIISSLELVRSDKEILWLHFGEGIMKAELEALAEKKLGHLNKIRYSFMGHYSNTDLLKYYSRNRIDLFLNTSSTEGLPVSIMEAQCFGIPVIATDTGGVKEIVTAGSGSLIPLDFNPSDLAELIRHYADMQEEEVKRIRMNAISNWELNFNASSNFNNFIMKLNSIFASSEQDTHY